MASRAEMSDVSTAAANVRRAIKLGIANRAPEPYSKVRAFKRAALAAHKQIPAPGSANKLRKGANDACRPSHTCATTEVGLWAHMAKKRRFL